MTLDLVDNQSNIKFNTNLPGVAVEPNNPVEGAGVVVVDPKRPPAAYICIRKKFRRDISNTTPYIHARELET